MLLYPLLCDTLVRPLATVRAMTAAASSGATVPWSRREGRKRTRIVFSLKRDNPGAVSDEPRPDLPGRYEIRDPETNALFHIRDPGRRWTGFLTCLTAEGSEQHKEMATEQRKTESDDVFCEHSSTMHDVHSLWSVRQFRCRSVSDWFDDEWSERTGYPPYTTTRPRLDDICIA